MIHARFRSTFDPQIIYQLYLCYQTKRLILELKCNTIDQRFFSVKYLSKYPTNYTHIDIIKSRYYSNYLNTFGDIFDIHTSIDKANKEELDINDHCYDFIHIKDIDQYIFETHSKDKQKITFMIQIILTYYNSTNTSTEHLNKCTYTMINNIKYI